jgi:hypothetical protein
LPMRVASFNQQQALALKAPFCTMAMSKCLRVSKLVKCKKYLKVTSNCWKMLKQNGTHRILIKQINKSTRKSVPWKHCLKRATLCNLKGNKKRNTQNKWIPTIFFWKKCLYWQMIDQKHISCHQNVQSKIFALFDPGKFNGIFPRQATTLFHLGRFPFWNLEDTRTEPTKMSNDYEFIVWEHAKLLKVSSF